MKQIKLTNCDLIAIIDDEDYDLVLSHNTLWSGMFRKINNTKTLISIHTRSRLNRRVIGLGRLILKLSKHDGWECDHIDRNPLNNQKSNLRLVNRRENNLNRKTINSKKSEYKSKYKGVSWDIIRHKWLVNICSRYRQYNGGRFDSEIEAACKADDLMIEHHGEFARLNFPLTIY